MNADEASAKLKQDFREHVERTARLHGHTVRTSQGRRYTFAWRDGVLRVRIGTAVYRRCPLVEWLAQELGATLPEPPKPPPSPQSSERQCPTCHTIFPRRGKRKYCTPWCASSDRKRRYNARRRDATLQARERRNRDARLARAEQEVAEKLVAKRKQRAQARREQRRGKKIREEHARLLAEREKAFRDGSGKDR